METMACREREQGAVNVSRMELCFWWVDHTWRKFILSAGVEYEAERKFGKKVKLTMEQEVQSRAS